MMTLKMLQKRCHEIAIKKGWWEGVVKDELVVYEKLLLMHTEISECVEDLRHGHPVNSYSFIEDKPIGPAVELADLLIRLLDLCEAFKIDLEGVTLIKMGYNETRPYRHGNKKL